MAAVTQLGFLGAMAAYLAFEPKGTAELPHDATPNVIVYARAQARTITANEQPRTVIA